MPSVPIKLITGERAQRQAILKEIWQGREKEGHTLYITSYNFLRSDREFYAKPYFDVIVVDEAQTIKNPNAEITKIVKSLHGKFRLALSGTPIENRPLELWSLFDFAVPNFLLSKENFVRSYEVPIWNNSKSAYRSLEQVTQPFLIRRLKKDVLPELPGKYEYLRFVFLIGEQEECYNGRLAKMQDFLINYSGNDLDKRSILNDITNLRLICCDPSLAGYHIEGKSAKRLALLEEINQSINEGHRMLIFSQFTSMLELIGMDLEEKNIPYLVLTGSTNKNERQRLVEEFNQSDIPIFLMSLQAGGKGLNLTGADTVVLYEPWWNVSTENQAADRAYRFGQTKKVRIIKLIAKDTLEEKMVALQKAKSEMAEDILHGTIQSDGFTKEQLLELLSGGNNREIFHKETIDSVEESEDL